MTVRVLFFAGLADSVGQREVSLDLPDGATVGDALAQLARQHASVDQLGDRLAVAVNMSYVKPAHVLTAGDEVALIPPVSGG